MLERPPINVMPITCTSALALVVVVLLPAKAMSVSDNAAVALVAVVDFALGLMLASIDAVALV